MSNLQASTTISGAANGHIRSTAELAARLETIGTIGSRYALAGVIAWIGAMKFTAYEAAAIQGLVASSPLVGWVYKNILSVEAFAMILGTLELCIALLIALKPVSARAAAVGSVLAIGMFGTTFSFLLSTPGAFETSLGGFPALSVLPGQFLIKDLVLLTAAIWMLADALKTIARERT